jgi:hypothetical protein
MSIGPPVREVYRVYDGVNHVARGSNLAVQEMPTIRARLSLSVTVMAQIRRATFETQFAMEELTV